ALRLGLELQRQRVDAVALAVRAGAVVEDVPEVPAARAAQDLGATHEEAVVGAQLDGLRDRRLGEARPAGAGVELRVAAEQHGAAARARVVAGLLVVGVLAGERRLGAGAAQHVVLLWRELLTPLLVGLLDSLLVSSHTYVLAAASSPRS